MTVTGSDDADPRSRHSAQEDGGGPSSGGGRRGCVGGHRQRETTGVTERARHRRGAMGLGVGVGMGVGMGGCSVDGLPGAGYGRPRLTASGRGGLGCRAAEQTRSDVSGLADRRPARAETDSRRAKCRARPRGAWWVRASAVLERGGQ